MFYPRLLLIGPFLLLATLAKSAPLPDPSCASCPMLSPASSLKVRTGPLISGEAEGDVKLFATLRKLFIDNFTKAKSAAWEIALHSENLSPEQQEVIKELEQYAEKVGGTVKDYSMRIEELKNVRP
ncbi:hypothetical protein A4X06_0g2596 [Tilletia controversa]|uniref:Uncharacterized protein n=1 Tax=Tilletia controversa TaxID=13291 RepID=A0A8X7MXA6_9BASI|nr:hypothetical protein CF328_g2130 [Tilletia controversa]KAE8251648.1 hypothetical protein A4X06_0g2596 [Tilletia controversa]